MTDRQDHADIETGSPDAWAALARSDQEYPNRKVGALCQPEGPWWLAEHGSEFDVPETIIRAEGLRDQSWRNDTCPRFGTVVSMGDPDGEEIVEADIWVEHPDPCKRETYAPTRYVVTLQASSGAFSSMVLDELAEGVQAGSIPMADSITPPADGWGIGQWWAGDDAAQAVAVLATLITAVSFQRDRINPRGALNP